VRTVRAARSGPSPAVPCARSQRGFRADHGWTFSGPLRGQESWPGMARGHLTAFVLMAVVLGVIASAAQPAHEAAAAITVSLLNWAPLGPAPLSITGSPNANFN